MKTSSYLFAKPPLRAPRHAAAGHVMKTCADSSRKLRAYVSVCFIISTSRM